MFTKWFLRLFLLQICLMQMQPATTFAPSPSMPQRRLQRPFQSCVTRTEPRLPPPRPSLSFDGWDGDDIRFWSKLRRRIRRSQAVISPGKTPAKITLIMVLFCMFTYQTIDTVNFVRSKNPAFWPSHALSIITDTLLGVTNVRGPLTTDFIFTTLLAKRQPHRYLTAGFLHADIIHLLLNIDALRRLPSWAESGLGSPLFLTAFLIAIIAGNIAHAMAVTTRSFCLGASGGICGVYGLVFVALAKMGNTNNAGRVLQNMLVLFGAGLLLDNVSNAGHLGGFCGGVVMGILCAPNYQKSYSMRRKWSLEVDPWSREYRQMMGFGVSPSKRGVIPLSFLWVIGAVLFFLEPTFRSIPYCIIRGLYEPGSFCFF